MVDRHVLGALVIVVLLSYGCGATSAEPNSNRPRDSRSEVTSGTAGTAEMRVCASASECVAIQVEAGGCCHAGRYIAVTLDYAEEARQDYGVSEAELERARRDQMTCTAPSAVQVACVDRQCEAVFPDGGE
jgi:hypothetical protein